MQIEYTILPEDLNLYIHLTWLYVLVITILMLFLCFLYLAKRRALQRESKSLAFSDWAIEVLETERRRISRELHDAVLPLIKETSVSDLIRAICIELSPPDFTRLSLSSAMAEICDKFSKRTGIICPFSIDENLSFAGLSPGNQLHLYRMIQEALTNIEKHSRAGSASLVARRLSEKTLICVSDDGTGFNDDSYLNTSGLGIKNMHQRAVIIGARLDFISECGNGLMVRILIPTQTINTKGL
jgi:signal transduction histidine kinase